VLTHDLSKKVSVGSELAWQQRDQDGGTAETDAGVGATVKLTQHEGLLLSGGPTWADHRRGYHFYASLRLYF
jgi:hypothetical protein